jgi:glucosamine--fructose-6-phosphate aminotransferase (isomerizing)
MIDYIHETPDILANTFLDNEVTVKLIFEISQKKGINKVVISGLGSSYTAALIAAPIFRRFCPLPTFIIPSTEIGTIMTNLIDHQTLFISVSRSGERGWVVQAQKESIRNGAMTVALTGMPNSLLAQNAHYVLETSEGPEITFAKTKSVTTCAGVLMRLGLAFATKEDVTAERQLELLQLTPKQIGETITFVESQIKSLISKIQAYKLVMIGGSIGNHGTALEFAIKLQETANIPVIANDTGNMLHGPWGLISNDWLIVILVTKNDLELSKKTLQLAGNLNASRLVICEPGLELDNLFEYSIVMPESVDPLMAGILYLIPIQLITYYWSISKGLNPDVPEAMRIMLDAMLAPGREEPEMRNLD